MTRDLFNSVSNHGDKKDWIDTRKCDLRDEVMFQELRRNAMKVQKHKKHFKQVGCTKLCNWLKVKNDQ